MSSSEMNSGTQGERCAGIIAPLLLLACLFCIFGCGECSEYPSSAFEECNPDCIKYNKACLRNDRGMDLDCTKTMVHGIDKYICTIACSSDAECDPGICSEQGYCVDVLDADWIRL